MSKRTVRILSLTFVIVGLVAADGPLPWDEGIDSSASRVFAHSRGRSKKKRHSVGRKRSRRKASAHRKRSGRSISASRGQSGHKISSRRKRSGRVVAARRRHQRGVPLRVGQQIPRDRVLEIQRALIERSYLKDATGVYDKATVEAMKAFQAKENIPVTGYPTAHALQRLKLSPSPTSISSATPQAGVPPDANQSKEQ